MPTIAPPSPSADSSAHNGDILSLLRRPPRSPPPKPYLTAVQMRSIDAAQATELIMRSAKVEVARTLASADELEHLDKRAVADIKGLTPLQIYTLRKSGKLPQPPSRSSSAASLFKPLPGSQRRPAPAQQQRVQYRPPPTLKEAKADAAGHKQWRGPQQLATPQARPVSAPLSRQQSAPSQLMTGARDSRPKSAESSRTATTTGATVGSGGKPGVRRQQSSDGAPSPLHGAPSLLLGAPSLLHGAPSMLVAPEEALSSLVAASLGGPRRQHGAIHASAAVIQSVGYRAWIAKRQFAILRARAMQRQESQRQAFMKGGGAASGRGGGGNSFYEELQTEALALGLSEDACEAAAAYDDRHLHFGDETRKDMTALRPGGRRPMERSVRFNHHLIALRRNRYVLDEEYDPFDVLEPRAPKKRGRRKRGPRLDLVHSVWRPRKLHGNSTDHSHAHSHAHSARRSQCRPCMERTAENAARRARCRQGLF